MKDYYKLLEISRLASQQEIKTATSTRRKALEKQINEGIVDALTTVALDEVLEAMATLLDLSSKQVYDIELDNCPPEKLDKDSSQPLMFDYSKHRVSDSVSWKEYVTSWEVATVDIYRQLLRQIIILPYPEIQENIVLSMLLCPTPLATMLPIMFTWSAQPGAGKSSIGKFASKIYGIEPVGSSTTASAFRRILQSMKFHTHNGVTTERPHLLIVDDINLQLMAQSQTLQQYLRSGFNRGTSKVQMAKRETDGETVTSDLFGGRVISSCYPFFSDPNYAEITRRMLIIECKKSDKSIDVIDPDSIDWQGFVNVRDNLWESDPTTCIKYGDFKRSIGACAVHNKIKRPDKINLGKDILACGLTLGLWDSVESALTEYLAFLDSNDALCKGKGDIVTTTIRRLVESTIIDLTSKGITPYIQPNTLKQVIEQYVRLGVFDTNVKVSQVNATMRQLGWEIDDTDYWWRQNK
jgi:hypothetical protein